MLFICSIEDPSVILAVLNHLGIWLVKSTPPLKFAVKILLTDDFPSSYSPARKREVLIGQAKIKSKSRLLKRALLRSSLKCVSGCEPDLRPHGLRAPRI
jgi:hypothetical protein